MTARVHLAPHRIHIVTARRDGGFAAVADAVRDLDRCAAVKKRKIQLRQSCFFYVFEYACESSWERVKESGDTGLSRPSNMCHGAAIDHERSWYTDEHDVSLEVSSVNPVETVTRVCRCRRDDREELVVRTDSNVWRAHHLSRRHAQTIDV